MPKQCKWEYEDIDDVWQTECGESFCVLMKFCPFCGNEIAEAWEGIVEVKEDET